MWIFGYIDLKTAPKKRRFAWLESQNKPSLAETWLIWYKIKSWKRHPTQADQKLSITGNQHFSPGDIQFQLVYDRGQCAESSYLKRECSKLDTVNNLSPQAWNLII